MPPTDTSESGLESLIMCAMTGTDGRVTGAEGVAEAPGTPGGTGWIAGRDGAYDREFAVDTEQLFTFLMATQPEEWAMLGIANYKDTQGMARQKFLARLQGEVTRRGVIEVLRHGIKHGALSFRPLLRPALGGEHEGGRTPREKPVQRHAATALQPRKQAVA